MTDEARVHIFVSGRVQGVFFRENTRKRAKKLGITGWVRNLPDGRLEAIFEGDKDKVEELINWTKRGPMFAKVNGLETVLEEYQGEFDNFEITCD